MESKDDLHQAITELQRLEVLPAINDRLTYEELLQALAAAIAHLINNNFPALVHLLYRVDISEQKLKEVLRHNQNERAVTIAAMIIDRQLKKIEMRKAFKKDENIREDEKW